jgi:SAM-dependent methyltransferase
MVKTPKDIVRDGYDRLSSAYRKHYQSDHETNYPNWLARLVFLLPPTSKVLELGCADGLPTAHILSQQFDYLGIDLSPVQIELARQNVPAAQFSVADMTALSFPDQTFSGIVALYSIIHIPLPEQPALLKSLYNWLKPNGYLLCTVGAGEWTGTNGNWIVPGALMYWSHTDASTYLSWFTAMGFTVVQSDFIPEGNSGHTLFLLRK